MIEDLMTEVSFRFSRSSGPGGQSVNKVSTQVELIFDLYNSNILNEDHKDKIALKLKSRITTDGLIVLKCNETRSQFKNREIVTCRFLELIKEALKAIKKRKPTRPTKSSVKKRLTNKKKQSEIKKNRKIVDE